MTTSSPAVADAAPFRFHSGDWLAVALLCAWAAFMFARIHYGFDFSDEGMYLSATDRLVHGDVPFRDDKENPLRQFDVLLALLWRPFGGFDLVQARALGAGLQLLQMIALWLVVRRWLGAWAAAICACVVPCVPLYAIWTAGYNETACAATVVAACALALAGGGSSKQGITWGIVAGVALGVDGLCYAPCVPLVAVPVVLALWGAWRGYAQGSWRHPWVFAGGAAVIAAGMVFAVDIGAIILSGVGGDWRTATADMVLQQDTAIPLSRRLMTCWDFCADQRLPFACALAGFAALRLSTPRIAQRLRGAAGGVVLGMALAAVCALVLALDVGLPGKFAAGSLWYGANHWVVYLWRAEMVLGLAALAVFIVPSALAQAWRGRTDAAVAAGGMVAMLLLFIAITAVASSMVGQNGLLIRGSVIALGAAGIAAFAQGLAPAQRRPFLVAAVLCQAVIGLWVGFGSWVLVFKDSSPAGCTATFSHPPLAGIRSTPETVVPLDALATWIDGHVPADATIIAYHDLPVLSFACRRRPALDQTWTTPLWSWTDLATTNAYLRRVIDRMHDARREPGVCVRRLTTDSGVPYSYPIDDPVHAYAMAHFAPAWRQGPFEAMLPLAAGAAPVAAHVVADLAHPDGVDANARIDVAPGVEVAPAADGSITLTVPASATEDPIIRLVQSGTATATIRVYLDTDSRACHLCLTTDGNTYTLDGVANPRGPGWDTTLPGGTDRGFVLMVAASAQPTTIVLHRFSLAVFPDLAVGK